MTVLANDPQTWLDEVWDALGAFRENLAPEGDPMYDAKWDEICTAMAWIKEAIDCDDP